MDVRITFRPRARTMLSCGTCYTAKRKVLEVAHVTFATVLTFHVQCDRKRPCGRCCKIGLVGISYC